jgi:uroporphyrinogen decarboxylase
MNDTFLKACRGEKTAYTPVWIMRQAGRFLPQYRAIHDKYGFLQMCRTPELAAKATMLPVDLLGVDAAIFFSDILTTVVPMGMDLKWENAKGPYFGNPVRSKADVDHLIVPDPEKTLSFVPKAVKILVRELKNKVPLIGFAGAPFTVSAFMIENPGNPRYTRTKKFMYEDPKAFHKLVGKVAKLTTEYLRSQIKAGANSVMLFDTCAVTLGPTDFTEFNLRYVNEVINGLKDEGVPIIYYVTGTAGLVEKVKECRADVIGVDWRLDLDLAAKRLGKKFTLQGNLDPFALFASKPLMERHVKEVLAKGAAARAHIFNLGDGILPDTPVANVKAMINAVHRLSRTKA